MPAFPFGFLPVRLARLVGRTVLAVGLFCPLASSDASDHGLDQPHAIEPFLNGKFPPQTPGPAGAWSVTRIYPNLTASLPTFAGPYPGTNKLLFVEKDGRIRMFENTPNVSTSETFLDIRSRVYSNSDAGMTCFAFHPDFGKAGSPNRRYVFITYKYSPNGDSGDQSYWRLSRFTIPDGQLAADPDSELILIQQFDRQQWHDSGWLLFGPDGFLYIGIGDEGGSNDQYNDTQKINDRLFSGVLRIDVNRDPTKSHPIRRQPLPQASMPAGWPASFTANYSIPNDNPFVNPDGSVLEEFYTLGHRNPYRFHYDPATGEIWEADVGQDTREEVNHLIKGANYGWAFREGFAPGPKSPPANIIGTLTEPLWDYDRSLGGAIVGAGFYYGSEHPGLRGKYLVVDNTSGRIWALSRSSPTRASAEYLTNMPSGSVYSGTTTALEMPNGEIFFVKLGGNFQSEIYKLTRTGASVPEPPAKLSDVGAFSDLATLTPIPGLLPYKVNAPLWSDHAEKYRWMAIPNDGTPDSAAEKIKFAPESEWQFPPGTVFVKHFELPVDDANPAVTRRLETRFLVISSTGEPYGVTYRWRPDGTDADLLTDGRDEAITIATAGGGTRQQTWSYPSRANCMLCHNANAKYVLGVKTHQLNGDLTYMETGRTANQLSTLAHLGFFDDAYHAEHLPYFLRSRNIADIAAPLETRIRSYIDSNCSQCHRPGGVRANFDARFVTPPGDQNLIWGQVESQFTGGPESVIRPADPAHSILYRRDALVGAGQMPPLAKNVIDAQWVSQLESWIETLGTGPAAQLALDHFDALGNAFVRVTFTNSVTGLTKEDFLLRGGTRVALTGGGAEYLLQIAPTTEGRLHVELPAGGAFAAGGLPNYHSNKLVVDRQEPSLVTWLKLDETGGLIAHDSSAGAHDGTVANVGGSDWLPDGKIDGALRFSQTGARVTLPNVVGGDFTIAFWIRASAAFPVTDTPIGGTPLFWADASGPNNDFTVAGTTSTGGVSRISFLTGQSGQSNVILHGAQLVTTGDWRHVAVRRIRSSGLMQIYVDGVLDGTTTGSTAALTAAANIEIASSGGSSEQFRGDLDQIRIYDRALSAEEIATLAEESATNGSPVDAWFTAQLPGLFHLHGLDLDPDGDGVSNADEFAFGTNPLADDARPLTIKAAAGGSFDLGSLVRADAAGMTYQIQFSTNLTQWDPAGARVTGITDVATPDPAYKSRTWRFAPNAGDPQDGMFFRLRPAGAELQ